MVSRKYALVFEESDLPARDVEPLLLCLCEVLPLVQGQLGVVDKGIRSVVVLRSVVALGETNRISRN